MFENLLPSSSDEEVEIVSLSEIDVKSPASEANKMTADCSCFVDTCFASQPEPIQDAQCDDMGKEKSFGITGIEGLDSGRIMFSRASGVV